MKLPILVFGLLVLLAATNAGNVDFNSCSSQNKITIHEIKISDCDNGAESFILIKGNTYRFDISAQTHSDAKVAKDLPYKLTGTVLGEPLTLLEGDACDKMTSCPIEKDEDFRWHVDKKISASTPAMSNAVAYVRIWINKQGTNAEAAACARFGLTIRNPSK